MSKWAEKLFIQRADLSSKIMNLRWPYTEKAVDAMVRLLKEHGIDSGRLLDLCCGNGRVSIFFAKKGFEAVGVDFSEDYIEDARERAVEHGVSDSVTFRFGDVRKLREALGGAPETFDVVVSAWTSIGYSTNDDDLSIFRQARELSKENSILFITETVHEGRASLRRTEDSFMDLDDMIMLDQTRYDHATSELSTTWNFYRKRGKDLEFEDVLEYKVHVYSLSELCSLLGEAGWEVEAHYGNISTLQPMSPFTSMNIVAKAC